MSFVSPAIKHKSRAGFTFVELLVVGATVVVLAAILFPLFAMGSDPAKSGQDLSNLKDLSRGAQIYVTDANDLFPPVGAPTLDYDWSPERDPRVDAAGRPWNGWGLRMAPYVKSYDVFRSPYFPKQGLFAGKCRHADGMPLTNNYSLNWMLGSDGSFGDPADRKNAYAWSPDGTRRFSFPMRSAGIDRPSGTVLFSPAPLPEAYDRGCLYLTVEASSFSNELRFDGFASEGANLAFADGHGRFVRDEHLSVGNGGWTLYHLRSRGIWMEPTMPESTMGYVNRDSQGHPLSDL